MKVIDGTDMILGRLATRVAKLALAGEEVAVVNCDRVIVIGKRSQIFSRYKQRVDRGTWKTGPLLHRGAERIVRRTIRGMLPYKTPAGIAAFKKVMCYRDVPQKIANEKAETFDEINVHKTDNVKFVTVKEISTFLGAKQ